jgi:uncharacterized protein YebE (UPF0316 family)
VFSQEFLDSDLFNWVVFPVLIFLSRMTDITMGTLRQIFINRGLRNIVPFLGFFETLLWLIAISQIMKNLNNVMCYFAWAGGFAMGIYVGMKIEERLALGMQVVRIITNMPTGELLRKFKEGNIGFTEVEGQGASGPVKVIFTIIRRKNLGVVIKYINEFQPQAFYSIEDLRTARQGIFSNQDTSSYNFLSRLIPVRKGK